MTQSDSTEVQIEIDSLVENYPLGDSKELFRKELEYLALIANKQGFIEAKELLDKIKTDSKISL